MFFAQESGVLKSQISESTAHLANIYMPQNIINLNESFHVLIYNIYKPAAENISDWLNVQAVRCTRGWFTKPARSLRTFSNILISSTYCVTKLR